MSSINRQISSQHDFLKQLQQMRLLQLRHMCSVFGIQTKSYNRNQLITIISKYYQNGQITSKMADSPVIKNLMSSSKNSNIPHFTLSNHQLHKKSYNTSTLNHTNMDNNNINRNDNIGHESFEKFKKNSINSDETSENTNDNRNEILMSNIINNGFKPKSSKNLRMNSVSSTVIKLGNNDDQSNLNSNSLEIPSPLTKIVTDYTQSSANDTIKFCVPSIKHPNFEKPVDRESGKPAQFFIINKLFLYDCEYIYI